MPTTKQILGALQYDIFNRMKPVNRSRDDPYRITYQFAEDGAPADLPADGSFGGWTAWSGAEKARFQEALQHIESFLNVDFVQVSGRRDPDLNVGKADLPSIIVGNGGYSVSYWNNKITSWDGFVIFDNDYDIVDGALGVILHELGHAMGLRHAHDTTALSEDLENSKYTVMSYHANPDTGSIGEEMMQFDVLALQNIWGAVAANPGNTVYKGPQNDAVDLIWDTGGRDTFDASGNDKGVRIDLRPGAFSQFGDHEDMVIARGVRIENAIGSDHDDWIAGNPQRNVIKGGDGADHIDGRNGRDRLFGQDGNDTLGGGNGRDRLNGGAGDDMLFGGGGKDWLFGGPGADVIMGGRGPDRFLFKPGSEVDRITDFGLGKDMLVVRGFGSKAKVLEHAHSINGDVVIDFGGGEILILEDTSLSNVASALIT